jgi:hypothetical protein
MTAFLNKINKIIRNTRTEDTKPKETKLIVKNTDILETNQNYRNHTKRKQSRQQSTETAIVQAT